MFIIASYLCGCGHHLHFSRTHCVSRLQNIPLLANCCQYSFHGLRCVFFLYVLACASFAFLMHFPQVVSAFLMRFFCMDYAFLMHLFCVYFACLMPFYALPHAFLMRFPCASYAFLIYLLCICIYMHVLCISYTVLLRFRMRFETNTCCFAQNVCMCPLRCMHACIVQSA